MALRSSMLPVILLFIYGVVLRCLCQAHINEMEQLYA